MASQPLLRLIKFQRQEEIKAAKNAANCIPERNLRSFPKVGVP